MEIDFFKSIAVGLCASVPLGPIGVVCIQRTINKGKFAGFISGLGAAFADTCFAILAVFCLSLVEQIIHTQQFYFLMIGGLVLLILGYYIFSTNPIKQVRRSSREKDRYFEKFFSTFLLTLSNPGALFLILGLFAFFKLDLADLDNYYNITSVVLGVLLGAAAWWFFLTTTIDHFRRLFRLRQLIVINKITGIIICILGLISICESLLL